MQINALSAESDPVIRAQYAASVAHYGQKNKFNGEAYILHPARVARYVPRAYDALAAAGKISIPRTPEVMETLVVAAWLHDVVEDTEYTAAQIETHFGPEVARIVRLLTRGNGSSMLYYQRIRLLDAALVAKFADIMDNADPTRLALLPEADGTRLEHKYDAAAKALGIEEELTAWKTYRTKTDAPAPKSSGS